MQTSAVETTLSATELDARLRAYLGRLRVPSQMHAALIEQVLQGQDAQPAAALARLQAVLAGSAQMTGDEAAWLRCRLIHWFGPSAQLQAFEAAPTKPMMYTLLPIRRQSMVPAHLERSLLRRLLLAWVYRPLGKLLRQLQLLRKRTLEG